MSRQEGMSEAERRRLEEQVRREERVAKSALKQRSAELKVGMEEQLSAVFAAEDERWKDVTRAARKFVDECDAKIAAICREMGVPEQFRPKLEVVWYSRGANASQERRAELRRLGAAKIDALEAKGKVAIELAAVEMQRRLVAGALTSEEARAFLAAMPTAEKLLPPPSVEDLEKEVPATWKPKLTAGYARYGLGED